jgi:chloramphenicol-sensitive protein RarD
VPAPPSVRPIACAGRALDMNRGVLYALGAYLMWGVFPIYFKAVQAVPPTEVLAHRVLWSLVFVAVVLATMRNWRWVLRLGDARVLKSFVVSAVLVSVNWLIYIWAVQAGRVVDASLGYFINPLVNVLIGAVFLHERLRRPQWVAVTLAALGVAWLTWQAGQPPWIGLSLALSFAAYALLRKTAPLGAMEGLAVETALLLPFALGWLLWLSVQGSSTFFMSLAGAAQGMPWLALLLMLSGPITAVPLLLFAAGARLIQFATLGLLQYVGPTLQLMLGVFLYHEPFDAAKLIGYTAIWIALAVFSIDGLWQAWSQRAARIDPG